jgi:hypothetical protein
MIRAAQIIPSDVASANAMNVAERVITLCVTTPLV